jgi:hypothetical protein
MHWGRINLFDFVIVSALLLTVAGVLVVQSGWHRTSGQVVQGETDIEYTILIRNLKTLHPDTLFEPGKKLSMTIRNQPRGDVKIVAVEHSPKKAVVPQGANGYQVIADPTDPNGHDFKIRLRDHALVSATGYVTEGLKVKVGMPIEVEGFNYRVGGVIADVQDAQP